jgi:hypothetical protein
MRIFWGKKFCSFLALIDMICLKYKYKTMSQNKEFEKKFYKFNRNFDL